MKNIMTGGFLKGYRTYVLGFLVVAQAVVSYLLGDIDLVGLLDQLPEMLGGFGLVTLRASVTNIRTPLLSDEKKAAIRQRAAELIQEELEKVQ